MPKLFQGGGGDILLSSPVLVMKKFQVFAFQIHKMSNTNEKARKQFELLQQG